MTRRKIAAIHVWRDVPSGGYAVSEVDADGDEIRCIDGDDDLADAWRTGCAAADDLGVPCIEYATESAEETRHYTPAATKEVR